MQTIFRWISIRISSRYDQSIIVQLFNFPIVATLFSFNLQIICIFIVHTVSNRFLGWFFEIDLNSTELWLELNFASSGKNISKSTEYRLSNWLRSSFHTCFYKLSVSLDINSWILSNRPMKWHNQTVSVSCCFFQVVII